VRVVLFKRGLDLWRSHHQVGRARNCTDGQLAALASEVVEAPESEWDRWRDQLREAVDSLESKWNRRAVDLHAVLLLQVRLRIARSVWRSRAPNISPPTGEAATVAEGLLPWREQEMGRAIRDGAATLADTWARLRPLLDRPPHEWTAKRICEAATGSTPVNAGEWGRWVYRVRQTACEAATGEAGVAVVAALVGRAEPREGSPGGPEVS
jgi:hypothetical protein